MDSFNSILCCVKLNQMRYFLDSYLNIKICKFLTKQFSYLFVRKEFFKQLFKLHRKYIPSIDFSLLSPKSIIVTDFKHPRFWMILILLEIKKSLSKFSKGSRFSTSLILLKERSSVFRFFRLSKPSIFLILLSYKSSSTSSAQLSKPIGNMCY